MHCLVQSPYRPLVFSVAVCLSILAPQVSRAEVIMLEVKIDAVDDANRKLTCTRNGKTLTLDITRNAKVTVNDKAGTLSDLGAGQEATLHYETKFEIVTQIHISGTPTATDGADPYFRLLKLTLGSDGKCQVVIDNQKDTPTPKIDGEKVGVTAFKGADVRRLNDGRLRILHDFSKFRDLDALKAGFLSPTEKDGFEEYVSIDEDDGVLVLIPDDNKKASFVYPRAVSGTIEATIGIAAFNEGCVQLSFSTLGGFLVVSLNGDSSPNGAAGTVSVVWSENSKFTPVLKFQASESGATKKEFKLPTEFDVSGQRFTLRVGLGSEVPCAFNTIQLIAFAPPSFGLALDTRGKRVVVGRVFPGSACEAAKIKRGDSLVSVNGTDIKSLAGAMKALGESGLGKDSTWIIERLGKKRTIVVVPQ